MIDISDIEPVPHPYKQSYVRTFLAEHNPVLLLGLSLVPILALPILLLPFFSLILKEVVLLTSAVLLVILLIVLSTAKPRALRKYIQAAQKEQEPYKNTYVA